MDMHTLLHVRVPGACPLGLAPAPRGTGSGLYAPHARVRDYREHDRPPSMPLRGRAYSRLRVCRAAAATLRLPVRSDQLCSGRWPVWPAVRGAPVYRSSYVT